MRSPASAIRALAALAVASAVPSAARAEDGPPPTPAALPEYRAQVVVEKGTVKLSVAFRDALDAQLRQKLVNGLPTVIAMRGYLFRESGADPIALAARSCRVVYDLWNEVFLVHIEQQGGAISPPPVVNIEGVLRHCCEVQRMPLIERAALAEGARYFVAALVEVNPVSPEMLDRIKRWVTRPNGASAIGPGDSLFGSFVGLFVARIGDADKKLVFRTQTFLPPPLEPAP
jgi:hypothetical protein